MTEILRIRCDVALVVMVTPSQSKVEAPEARTPSATRTMKVREHWVKVAT